MALETDPIDYAEIDSAGGNSAALPLAESVNGFNDGEFFRAIKYNAITRNAARWKRWLDQTRVPVEHSHGEVTCRLSAIAFEYTAAAGLTQTLVGDAHLIVEGRYVALTVARLSINPVYPSFTFAASMATHFYVAPDGTVTHEVVAAAVTASPPAGTYHLHTVITGAVTISSQAAGPDFTTQRALYSVLQQFTGKVLVSLDDGSGDVALIVNSAENATALEITGVSASKPAVLVNAPGTCYAVDMGGAAGTGFSAPVGAAAGTSFKSTIGAGNGVGFSCVMTGATAFSRGVNISANVATLGVCLDIANAGSGVAVEVTHSGTADAVTVGSTGTGKALVITGAGTDVAAFEGGTDYCVTVNAGVGSGIGLYTSGGSTGGNGAWAVGGPNADGVLGQGGTTSGKGGVFWGTGTGVGVECLGGSGAAAGLTATGGTGGPGAILTGDAAGYGADVIGGATAAAGLRASAVGTSTPGVHGRTAAAATIGAAGVFGEGRGNGNGLISTSVNSYALFATAKISTPVYSTQYMTPQTTYPTSLNDGDFTYAQSAPGVLGHLVHASTVDSAMRAVHSSLGGFIHGSSLDNAASNSNGTLGSYSTLCTIVMSGGNVPKQGGRTAIFRVAMRVRVSVSGTPGGINVRITDNTAGVSFCEFVNSGTGATNGWRLAAGSTGWDATIAFEYAYTMPITSRSFTLAFQRQSADAFTVTANGGMTICGLY